VPGCLVEVVKVAKFFKVHFTRILGSVCCGVPYFWCICSTFQYVE
jgi:hypothetical protein